MTHPTPEARQAALEWTEKQIDASHSKLERIPSWEAKQINNVCDKLTVLETIRQSLERAALTDTDTVSVTRDELEELFTKASGLYATKNDIIANADTITGAAAVMAYNKGIAKAIDVIRSEALSIIDRKGGV